MATHYILPGLQLESDYPFASFSPFASNEPSRLPLCTLTLRYAPAPSDSPLFRVGHADFSVSRLPEGWLYILTRAPEYALYASLDHRQLTAYITDAEPRPERLMPLVRTALECAGIPQGVLSLHSSCVTLDGQGICFTAPSGTGKSTRAMSWQSGLGAELLSGDRPSICIRDGAVTVSGAPWDGKEQLFVNRIVPLRAICSIRRGIEPYLRRLSPAQAKKLLCQQCFVPMWDTESAAAALVLMNRLIAALPIYRVVCGPDEAAAAQVRDIIFYHPERIKEPEMEMKIKQGFALRSISGEHVVMPTGKNISAFDGTIVLNDVAAFVWEKLTQGCSREELLQAILSEFDVDTSRAESDLDALLNKLHEYQVLEETL